jgi:DNA polymerase III epsilon subunit-like protein
MNKNFLAIVDCETSSAQPSTTQILSLAGIILDPHSLEKKSEFYSLLKPIDFSTVEEGALKVNRLTIEELEKSPDSKITFQEFGRWVRSYNKGRNKNSTYDAPIFCGYNIINFDLPIIRRYCQMYNFWDEKRNDQNLFNQVYYLDVLQHMWWLNYSSKELPNLKLGEILKYLGVSTAEIAEGHNALVDVQNTAKILRKLIGLSNYLTAEKTDGTTRLKLKNSLLNTKENLS